MFGDIRQSMKNDEPQQQKYVPQSKNEEQLRSKIPAILKSYEQLKEWSDLGQWLLKIQQILQNHPCSIIPKKKLFCKRLALCLSPVWNKAIHENALLIYDIILQNLTQNPEYNLVHDLPLFSLGLFPFFGFASIQCKPMVLTIFEKYYYPLKHQLMPSVGGLINSIIVGMEDTNEEMMKKVMTSLDMACESVGVKCFYGMIWTSILRSSRCRLGAYKYLMKRWHKSKQSEELEEQHQDEEKMPNKSALVINALLASLEDESPLIKRAALDFMCNHGKLQDNVFLPGEYLLLVQACLLLFIKLDQAVVRRVNAWFFGEEEIREEMEIIKVIQEALKRILQEDQSEPLKIIQNWYMQHPETVKMTLKPIGTQLVKYIFNKPQVEKASERLVESIASHSELVLHSLYEQLQHYVQKQKQEEIKECLNYIDYAFNQLMKQQFSETAKVEDAQQYQSRTECLQQLIRLVIYEIVDVSVQSFYELGITQTLLEVTLDCLIKVQQRFAILYQDFENHSILIQQQQQDKLTEQDIQAVRQYSEYYIKLNQYALENHEDRLFGITSQILLKLQLFLMKVGEVCYNSIPDWLNQLFSSLGGTNNQSVCSIDIIIEIIKQGPINANCHHLAQMITSNSYRDVYDIAPMTSLATFKSQDSEDKPNYVKALFERLWSLIDYNYHDSKIVEFILYVASNYKHVFIFVIEQSLLKDEDLRKFQIFCRLTNQYYRKHPKESTGAGLLTMLSYLENENPLLRHNSRTWLTEQAPFLFRVLDPILARLEQLQQDLQNNTQSIKDSAPLVVDTIKKLSLLFQAKEWFTQYIQNTKPTNSEEPYYLHYMCRVLIGFLTATFQDGQSQENSKINAISAEFMETLINSLSSGPMKTRILITYIKPVLQKLETVIANQDAILQIQVLNLIKVFVLTTKEVQETLGHNDKMSLIDIYQSPLFYYNLINGLKQAEVFFLKSRYLNTIVLSVYSLSEILPPKILTERVSMLISNILQLLKSNEFNKQKQQTSLQTRRLSHIDYIKIASKQWNQQEFATVTDINQLTQDNTTQLKHISASGENFEEVMSFSNAIRAIMSYYFRFKYEIKDIETKPNIAGILVDILTFNVWKQKNDKPNAQNGPQFAQFQETCQMLLGQLPNILLSYLECWRLSLYWGFLTTKGCIVYEYQSFEDFNKQLKEQLNKPEDEYTDSDQIKQSILQIISPCTYQFMPEMLSAMISIWQNEYSNNFYAEAKSNPVMCKLMELAITLQLPPEDFIVAFLKTPQVQSMMQYYHKRSSKKGVYFFNYDQATTENGILFFLYTYLATSQYQSLKPQQLVKVWVTLLQITKALLASRHVNTVCFILELFYMMSWKFSPKEILQQGDLKKEMHTQIRHNLVLLSEMAASQSKYITISITSNESYSVAANDSNLQLIVPFTPVIFELYSEYTQALVTEGEKTEEARDLYWIQRTIFDPYKQRGLKLDQEEFSKKCALLTLKTLKRLAYVTLINTYEASRNERILENTQEFMANIFPLMENKVEANLIIVEAASELLHNLLKNLKEQLPQDFKRHILDIFNGSEFFKCSRRSLKYWTEIIDQISEKGDLLIEQLGSNQNFIQGFAGLFTSRNTETLKKIKGFERVCFIIYSGSVDKYGSKLNSLLDAILNVIKDLENQHPAITVLIIFCIRILVLRLSPQALNQVFRRIWPSLIAMLMQIFNRKGVQNNGYVLQAGLKLIELFSLFQLEEFYFYQWMFVFDYFGITIDMKANEVADVKVQVDSPYEYVPLMAYQFPNMQRYSVDYDNKLYPDQIQSHFARKKRLIIIKDQQQENEIEVRRKAVYLCQYLLDINQQRVEVSPLQLESLIEAEFISLDEYIFTIN